MKIQASWMLYRVEWQIVTGLSEELIFRVKCPVPISAGYTDYSDCGFTWYPPFPPLANVCLE
jgi:hypothetical protein